MKADTERRSGRRIPTRVATRVRTAQGVDQTAQTRDVSANGVFLYTKSRMEKGTDVELVLILPPELTSGEKCWVCCQATIVRVEEEGTVFGVAAQIPRMDIAPKITVLCKVRPDRVEIGTISGTASPEGFPKIHGSKARKSAFLAICL